MKTHKDLNVLMSALIGDAEVVEIERMYNDRVHVITKTVKIIDYSSDVNLAIEASKRISDKYNYTFVLNYVPEESRWKASFGDYRDCSEYSGFNPAYCICMSILTFMGKL